MSAGNRKRRRELGLLPDPARCVARTRKGTPCAGRVVAGANVCRMHGGSAPQVKRKAAERIANASDIAVLQILALMQAPDTPAPVKLAAAKDLLDRANLVGKTTVELDVAEPWKELLLAGIVADVPEGTPMREFAEAEGTDPLVIEARRVGRERELADYAPADRDWSHPAASDSEPPPPPTPSAPPPPRRANGDERLPQVRRRLDGEDDPLPPHYEPSYRPRSRLGRRR